MRDVLLKNRMRSVQKYHDQHEIFTLKRGSMEYKKAIEAKHAPSKRVVSIHIDSKKKHLSAQIFCHQIKVSLSELMPIFQNLNLDVLRESEYTLKIDPNSIDHDVNVNMPQDDVFVHDIQCHIPDGFKANDTHRLCEGFEHILNGACENDRLNALLLKTNLTYAKIIVLRALIRVAHQMSLSDSIDQITTAILTHPVIAERLMAYFEYRFNPVKEKQSSHEMNHLELEINKNIEKINSSDDDRLFHNIFSLLTSCVRTNFYQNKDYVAFKFKSDQISHLAKPIPLYEIFVYAPFMEGIHIRTHKVSRGGIRWSDRPDDYRKEVLELAKTQTIKNSIIIPLGAKGGYISRKHPQLLKQGASKDTLKKEVLRCYQTFIQGLLDLTDNQKDGSCVHPKNVVCYDGDDPYLVVAADKGTASFSDSANALAKKYHYWLDDAFASGGSVGYDHKKMAITSRGVWISVKHHFSALGINDQTDSFTVIGVGDMSGDIFGNCMLQSPTIRLVGAFNHESIFIDPDPDALISFHERKRLFDLPNSTWSDYNKNLLSQGGGVFNRDAKTIPISHEIRFALRLPDACHEIKPEELIQHLLKAPVDLLLFGGIGTYVKSIIEVQSDVGDAHNDTVRIDANQLICRVIAEGANLAMTQKARIDFARLGGRLNMDAVDNSAGVSCSDHEVNIKILFRNLIKSRHLTHSQRDRLMPEMKDNVAQLVLLDNYTQNQVLTRLEANSKLNLASYTHLIQTLQKKTQLSFDRTLESLPTDQEIEQRIVKNQSLTRPELAIIMAYTKIYFFHILSKEPLMTDQTFIPLLVSYFPTIIQERFTKQILNHQLALEIIATRLSNQCVNDLGPVDAFEMLELYKNNILALIHALHFVNDVFDAPIEILTARASKNQPDSSINVIVLKRQLMMIYLRHIKKIEPLKREKVNFKKKMNDALDQMPVNTLPEVFELFLQTDCVERMKAEKSHLSEKSKSGEKSLSEPSGCDCDETVPGHCKRFEALAQTYHVLASHSR